MPAFVGMQFTRESYNRKRKHDRLTIKLLPATLIEQYVFHPVIHITFDTEQIYRWCGFDCNVFLLYVMCLIFIDLPKSFISSERLFGKFHPSP